MSPIVIDLMDDDENPLPGDMFDIAESAKWTDEEQSEEEQLDEEQPDQESDDELPDKTLPNEMMPEVPDDEVPVAQTPVAPTPVAPTPVAQTPVVDTMPDEVPNRQAPDLPVEEVPVDVVPEHVHNDPPSSTMPPPLQPTSTQIPAVNLLPPTPNTSQEAATSGPSTLLVVPEPSLPARHSRSRSRSPAPDASQLRRSPRILSPVPGSKRPPSDPLEERAAKKPRDQ